MSTAKPIKTAVIGLGKKGWTMDLDRDKESVPWPQSHVVGYLHNRNTLLSGVVETDPFLIKKFKEQHSDIPVYTDIQKMMDEVKPELVSVVTPVDTHGDIVRLIARYHPLKVIFCEKPIADSIAEAQRMIRCCNTFNVQLVINHTRRWDPLWINAKKMVNDELGAITKLVGYCSGGPLAAGVHMADLFNWFGDEKPFHYIDLKLKHDPPYTPYLLFELDVFGVKGRVQVVGNGDMIFLFRPMLTTRFNTSLAEVYELDWQGKITSMSSTEPTPIQRAITNLVDLVRNSEDTINVPACTGEDGLKALETCFTWVKSDEDKQTRNPSSDEGFIY